MVKQGYKQTEIGVIPEDWEVVNFDQLTIENKGIKIGPFGSQLKKDFLTKKGFKVYGQENVFENNFDIGDRFLSDDHYNKLKSCEVKSGDFLISMMGTIGKCAIAPSDILPGIIDSHLIRIRFNKAVYNIYMLQLFQSEIIINQVKKLSVGGIMDGLSSKIVKSLQIPLPPLAEQEAIASALWDADAWIESLEQLIAKKRLIKQGAMQTLLTPKEDWEVKKLGEVGEILNNLRIPIKESEREKGDNPYYGANGIQGYVKGYTHDGENVLLAEDGANDLKNYPVNFAIGKIWVNNHAHVLKGKENIIITRFLSYLLKSVDFTNVLVGGTRAKLNKSVLENIEISYPSLSEQERIATILSDMDAELEALETQLGKARQIKQGMMQELLTGRVRLV